ncbi:carbohydrate kinase [Microcoleus sp. LEGE 07076]|uniref:carbohydrate kinase family protein n=1 Tax=Microcoleus sp. LEGE 07076 TaxID=915322 RepID=UPI00188161BC|nr:carbohydrate kinase [Microcoleus sp. LEGE 07076]MBE9183594.1 carbohydrate kinase [Microcoleus sp. LEGE 07076]
MTYPRVLCLGEILFDCLADQTKVSLEEVESWTAYPGGAPANVACALVKLGTAAGFIGAVGGDELGNSLVQVLQEVGVDTTGVQQHPTAPTRQVYVLRNEAGDRSFAGFGKLDTAEFADTRLQAAQIPEVLFQNAEFLVLGTLELAYAESRKAIERAIELAEVYDVTIIVDINWRPVFWANPDEAKARIIKLLKKVDFLKLSDEEAEWLFGTTDAGAITYRLDSVEGVLVTGGEKGCAYCISENEGKIPAFKVDVEDTTGAGDAFLAGFVRQLCKHRIKNLADPEIIPKIVTYASAVGAMSVMKPGAITAQPTAPEVEAFLYLYKN